VTLTASRAERMIAVGRRRRLRSLHRQLAHWIRLRDDVHLKLEQLSAAIVALDDED
jgi:hypothetical protein